MHKSKSATSHWSRFRIEHMFGFCDSTNRCPRRRAPCGLIRDRLKKFTLYLYSEAMVIGVSILYTNILILSGWELEKRYRIQIHVHHTISPKAPFDPFVWGSFQSKFAQFGMDFFTTPLQQGDTVNGWSALPEMIFSNCKWLPDLDGVVAMYGIPLYPSWFIKRNLQ